MSYKSVNQYTCSQVHVNFTAVLGSGSFGTVYKGRFNGDDVAVKVINGENSDSIREIRRMAKVSGHANVLTLLGAVEPGNHYNETCHKRFRDTTWMVMEYMDSGNLLIRNDKYGVSNCPMDYLHRFCNVVHMDLAARNVLVTARNGTEKVKIGDFGLCRNYDYEEQYYNSNGSICAIRWMPPENLPYNQSPQYSRKGDVWSFGVILFELWSKGKLPFANMTDHSVIQAVRRGQTVLDYHYFSARGWVKDLMRQCFSFNKEQRPNFRKIYNTIRDESEYQLDSDEDDDDMSSDYSY